MNNKFNELIHLENIFINNTIYLDEIGKVYNNNNFILNKLTNYNNIPTFIFKEIKSSLTFKFFDR